MIVQPETSSKVQRTQEMGGRQLGLLASLPTKSPDFENALAGPGADMGGELVAKNSNRFEVLVKLANSDEIALLGFYPEPSRIALPLSSPHHSRATKLRWRLSVGSLTEMDISLQEL